MRNDNVKIRSATREDVLLFYENIPTMNAWVAEYNGEIKCIAGITKISNGYYLAFSEVKEHDALAMTVYRTAKKLFEKLKSCDVPIVAIPDERFINSKRFLFSVGFHEQDGVMTWRP